MKCKLGISRRKAVAPIIATLLMVAIAVVGGVMIYVFTQGFFSTTKTSTLQTDILSMTGYDLREVALPTIYNGATTAGGDASVTNPAVIEVGSVITLNVKNVGQGPITVSSVKVNGTGTSHATGALTNGQWAITNDDGTINNANTQILPGKEASLAIKTSEVLRAGTVSIEVISGGGAFSFDVIVGTRK